MGGKLEDVSPFPTGGNDILPIVFLLFIQQISYPPICAMPTVERGTIPSSIMEELNAATSSCFEMRYCFTFACVLVVMIGVVSHVGFPLYYKKGPCRQVILSVGAFFCDLPFLGKSSALMERRCKLVLWELYYIL